MISIFRRYEFSAMHFLPGHPKCGRWHGHNFRVEVSVSGQIKRRLREEFDHKDNGMVLDFWDLDDIVKPLIEGLDHSCLNDLTDIVLDHTVAGRSNTARFFLALPSPYLPTSEVLCKGFFDTIEPQLPNGITMEFVRVWETDRSYAECSRNLSFPAHDHPMLGRIG